jgi:hypothetical protein
MEGSIGEVFLVLRALNLRLKPTSNIGTRVISSLSCYGDITYDTFCLAKNK